MQLIPSPITSSKRQSLGSEFGVASLLLTFVDSAIRETIVGGSEYNRAGSLWQKHRSLGRTSTRY